MRNEQRRALQELVQKLHGEGFHGGSRERVAIAVRERPRPDLLQGGSRSSDLSILTASEVISKSPS